VSEGPNRYNMRNMRLYRCAILLAVVLAGAACSSGRDVEWMKVNQKYTAAEFRKDYAECEKTGKLDECLQSRGWVSVTAPNVEKPKIPEIRSPYPPGR
jgi:hypothetical protein